MEQDLHLPEAWQQTAETVKASGGIVVILGSPNAGKTTLFQYLAETLSCLDQKLAVVDADMGQSTLGPPTTINGVLLGSHCSDLRTINPQRMFFVGSTSPAGYFPQVLVGTKRLVEWAVSSGASYILVDTTGFIRGQEAALFKFHKIDLLQPQHLIVLQEQGELESLIRPFLDRKSLQIYRLPISPRARTRSPVERKTYRERRFRDYFKKASMQLLSTRNLTFLHWSFHHLADNRMRLPRYLLVGLNDADHWTVALGIVQTFDRESQEIFIYTPLQDLTAVKSFILGSLRVNLHGNELDFESSRENLI